MNHIANSEEHKLYNLQQHQRHYYSELNHHSNESNYPIYNSSNNLGKKLFF